MTTVVLLWKESTPDSCVLLISLAPSLSLDSGNHRQTCTHTIVMLLW
jgi:hypothetical protein